MLLEPGPLSIVVDGRRVDRDIIDRGIAHAALLQRELAWIVRVPTRTQDGLLAPIAEQWRAALPADAAQAPITVLRSAAYGAWLAQQPAGALLGLAPDRRSGLWRWVAPNAEEQHLTACHTPLVALAAAARPLRQILFPADLTRRSAPALEATIALCQRFGSALHLVHIFGGPPRPFDATEQTERSAQRTARALYDLDRAMLNTWAERARAAGVAVTAQYAEGEPTPQILRYVEQHDIDWLLLVSHGARDQRDILGGTTTAQLIRRTNRPVIAWRSAASPG
jgi:nucleotide-binding universal stress UspA family protein